jgi:hypothetical protein
MGDRSWLNIPPVLPEYLSCYFDLTPSLTWAELQKNSDVHDVGLY